MTRTHTLYEVTHYGTHDPQSAGPMRFPAAVQSLEAIRKILDCLGLPPRAPPIRPSTLHDEGALEWA